MNEAQPNPVDLEVGEQRKPRTKKAPDHRKELHTRLDRFLDNPINPATLDSLVSGLVDYELGVRLSRLDETSNE